ncbi:unnamed protein product [Prunus brigantina]
MSKCDKDVIANKKLHMSLHSMVQNYLQGDVSTQPEVQRNIDLELIKKNIKDDELDFAHHPPFSIQEKEVYVEVSNLPGEDILKKKKKKEKKEFEFNVPSRDKSYMIFKRHLGRRLLIKNDTRHSSFCTNSELCMSTFFILLTIYNQCFIGKPHYIKKREIYYIDTNQFKSEYGAYGVIDDVCCMLSRTRSSVRVISDSTCKVIGPFTFVCDDTPHDCSFSAEEIVSCHRIVRTSFNSCDASFILLVEMNMVFHSPCEIS